VSTKRNLTRVEEELLKRGMNQKELAEALGYSTSVISQVVGGFRKTWPKLRREVAGYFELAEDELFNQDGTLKESEAEFITIPVRRAKRGL